MDQHEWLDDARVASIEAALRPHAWRKMSARAVARRVVEAIDGTVDDNRAWIVEHALSSCLWRGLSVAGLAGQAAVALQEWDAGLRRLHLEVASLLDPG